jgi:hypothetical protein
MSDAREFAADLLSGARSRIDDTVRGGTRGGLGSTEEILQRTRASIEQLELLRATDVAEALRVFRGVLMDGALTEQQLDQFIAVYRTAVDDPETFQRNVCDAQRGGPEDWWDALRAFLHRPAAPNADEQTVLANLAKVYVLPSHPAAPRVNPHERMLETLDPAWALLAKAKYDERNWPDGLAVMPRHSEARPYVYDALDANSRPLSPGAAHQIALLADFGTGYYHSWGIAEQIASWRPSYTFHLGDVYYGGSADEFVDRFELPLFDVVENTWFMGLAENHELYAGGEPYLQYFAALASRRRTQQEGSYFCVRFPHHQVIAIDVNWQGRQRYQDDDMLRWLADRLRTADGRTNILLTGSAPFDHGCKDARPLLDDLRGFVEQGAIGLWFWGDDHYCALFDRRDPDVPFYGSCIGHGGFPGPRQTAWRATYLTSPLWVEDLARFPVWSNLRDDVTNNGWCHATLRPDGGVDLMYVDWLWCKRMAISFSRSAAGLRADKPVFFDRDSSPEIYRPR